MLIKGEKNKEAGYKTEETDSRKVSLRIAWC